MSVGQKKTPPSSGVPASWPNQYGVNLVEGLKSQMLFMFLNVSDQKNPEIYQKNDISPFSEDDSLLAFQKNLAKYGALIWFSKLNEANLNKNPKSIQKKGID